MIPYVNLTSGLEMLGEYPDARLVRIQSSHFEAVALWHAVIGVDYAFLIDAAKRGVLLVDCGSRRSHISRAQWQGAPWLRYAYERANGSAITPCRFWPEFGRYYERGHRLRDTALSKLRYVHKLTGSPTLNIEVVGQASSLDGNYPALAERLVAA